MDVRALKRALGNIVGIALSIFGTLDSTSDIKR